MKFKGIGLHEDKDIKIPQPLVKNIKKTLATKFDLNSDEIVLMFNNVILDDFHRIDFYNIRFDEIVWFGTLSDIITECDILLEIHSDMSGIAERIVVNKNENINFVRAILARFHRWIMKVPLYNHKMQPIKADKSVESYGLVEFPVINIISRIPTPFIKGPKLKFRGFGKELYSDKEQIDLVKMDLSKAVRVDKNDFVLICDDMILESDDWIKYYRIPNPVTEDVIWFGKIADYLKLNEIIIVMKSMDRSGGNSEPGSMFCIPVNIQLIVRLNQRIGEIRNHIGKIYKWIAKIPFWNFNKERLKDDQMVEESGLLNTSIIYMSTPSVVPCLNEGLTGETSDPKSFVKALGSHIIKSSVRSGMRSLFLSHLQSLPPDSKDRDRLRSIIEDITPMSYNVALSSISTDQSPMLVVGTEKITVSDCKKAVADRVKRLPEEIILIKSNQCLKDDETISNYEYSPDSYFALRSGISYFSLSKLENIVNQDPVGEGGFGKVYQCEDLATNKVMAVKEIKIPKNKKLSDVTSAIKEILTFSKLECHQRIIQYFDFFQKDEKTFCITMEYMANGSLSSYLEINGPLEEREIARISTQVLEGLLYLHNNQILHRDIKGGNILLDDKLNAKLADFGLSKCSEEISGWDFYTGILQSNVGTQNWTAPEVLNDEAYGLKADIWSFGATVVEMVVGERPYADYESVQLTFKLLTDKKIEFTPPKTMTRQLEEFIAWCLKPEPHERPTAQLLLNSDFIKLNK